ncbi:MAG: cysteine desulfurase NifS [Candidatus Aenigmatarchaeota archaeon]
MKRVYMDYAASTPVRREVLEGMMPYFSEKYGNASSLHSFGREAFEAVENARKIIAGVINAEPGEIIFTSGGTEADNLALQETAYANRNRGNHIIVSSIEHDAVLQTAKFLEKDGFSVTRLPVDKCGLISLDELENSVTKDTILVSIMHANNEIGTIEPVGEIGKICKERNVIFHTDAVQTFGKIPIDVKKMNIDLLSISSHKIYGPKGVGALYVRKGVKMHPLFHGGGQESGLRSGTENVAGIIGFGKAAELACVEMDAEAKRLAKLRDKLIAGALKIDNTWLNGHATERLPNNANLCFKFIEGEGLVILLDEAGIAASTGSACSSKSLEPSHVLLAIGLKHEEAHGSLRLTLGRETAESDVDYLLSVLPGCVERLRRISPFKKGFEV